MVRLFFVLRRFFRECPCEAKQLDVYIFICCLRSYPEKLSNSIVQSKNEHVSGNCAAASSQNNVFKYPTKQLCFNLFCTWKDISEGI